MKSGLHQACTISRCGTVEPGEVPGVRLGGRERQWVTWETLGINGAQADLLLGWNEDLLRSHIEQRDPALIVLAYGTNEARRTDWTYETYKSAFKQLLARLRAAAPASSLLVVGPPDQSLRQRGKWVPSEGVDRIIQAQRDAALESGAAFWNMRFGMGGKEA